MAGQQKLKAELKTELITELKKEISKLKELIEKKDKKVIL